MPAPQTGQTPRAMGRPLALVVYVTRCIGWCSRQRAHHPISSPLRVSCASASESSDAAAGVGCSAAPMSPFAVGGGASSGDPGAPGAAGGGASSGDPGDRARRVAALPPATRRTGRDGRATAGTGCSAAPMSPFAVGGGASSGDPGAPGVTAALRRARGALPLRCPRSLWVARFLRRLRCTGAAEWRGCGGAGRRSGGWRRFLRRLRCTGRGGWRRSRGCRRRGRWRQGRWRGCRYCAARCDQRLPSPGDFPPHQPQDRHNCRQAQQTPDG
jgi:hypothetical protein